MPKKEKMTTEQLFTILDDFEQRTRDRHFTSLAELAQSKGEQALQGHNFIYSFAGDVMRELDPYVPVFTIAASLGGVFWSPQY